MYVSQAQGLVSLPYRRGLSNQQFSCSQAHMKLLGGRKPTCGKDLTNKERICYLQHSVQVFAHTAERTSRQN